MKKSDPRYCLPFDPKLGSRRIPAPFHRTRPEIYWHIDWAMPPGTPILAARNGIVIGCQDGFTRAYDKPLSKNRFRANFVMILHEDGETSIYVHLFQGSVRVRLGQRVRSGQIIGLSGQTGYSTYPHLHFGVNRWPGGPSIKIKFKNNPR